MAAVAGGLRGRRHLRNGRVVHDYEYELCQFNVCDVRNAARTWS